MPQSHNGQEKEAFPTDPVGGYYKQMNPPAFARRQLEALS